jgi:uncharacterized GH25 family protein
MKTDRSIGKSVLTVCVAAIAVLLLLVWFKLRSRDRSSERPVAEAPATTQQSPKETMPAAAPTVAPAAPVSSVTANGLPPVVPIPLAPVLIDAENGPWLRDKNAPHAAQEFGGIEFLLDGRVQLQSRDPKTHTYRTHIEIPVTQTNFVSGQMQVVQIGSNIASLHLLGATRSEEVPGTTFAQMTWRYADGSSKSVPLQYQVHLRDWARNTYEQPAHLPNVFSKVVWVNKPHSPHVYRLYRLTLANPAPQKIIQSIEFDSAMTGASLFVVGLTLDPLAPGERPDPSPDLEPADPSPPAILQVYVQDENGAPLSGADIRTFARAKENVQQVSKTDASGVAQIGYAPVELQQFQLSVSRDGYIGRRRSWDLSAGDVMPQSYTVKLGSGGISIGGVVVDQDGNPIAKASIELNRFWMGAEDPRSQKDSIDFPSQKQTTDAQGRWQAKGLPAELLDHIGFDVSHSDYPPTNYTVGASAAQEKELRDGTFRTVLHRGLEVSGRVVDDQDAPLTGATVYAGKKYFRERQQKKTDAQGRFSFRGLAEGDVLFSVMAAGRKPDSKTFTVKPDMEEIVFKLGAGSVIRARVQNESGDPLSGTHVAIEGRPGEDAYDAYEFQATTDSDGRFTWDGAPDGPVPFYVFHDGYEAKRGVELKPDTDNVVTLRTTRQLQGLVLDASNDQPVTNFNARVGQHYPGSSDVYGVIDQHQFNSPDGRFTLKLNEDSDNAVAVTADGYAQQIETFSEGADGTAQVVVRLKATGMLDGVVLAPDGTPAPGVSVAVVSDNNQMGGNIVQLSNGRLRSFGGQNKVTTTDESGHFHIPSLPESGTVVAAGKQGFARVPIAQVQGGGTITLGAWGRIEGTLMIAGKPGTGQQLLFSFPNGGLATDYDGFKSTVDDQGHFSMENVPPGEGSIVRLVPMGPQSWMHSYRTSVTVEPGQTTQVNIGDTGGLITGSVRWETPPAEDEKVLILGELNTQMPPMPSFKSQAEAQAYFQSPEFREQQKQMRNYSAVVNADGTLSLDSIPPGTYMLNVSAMKSSGQPFGQTPIASGSAQITVPSGASPSSPIAIGEIVLKPVPKQN